MEETIKRRIAAEPRHGVVLYRILGDCLEPIAFDELEERVRAYPEMRVRLHEPATLVSWLVDVGALEVIEGEGAAEDDAADAVCPAADSEGRGSTDPTADPAISLVVTEAGRRVQAEHAAADEVASLMEAADPLACAYRRVLELCRTPQSKGDVERALVAEGLLDTRKRQVSCLLDRLERAGGLVWDAGWTATQLGLSHLD